MRAPYPTYKSTSIPWLPEMPEHWDVRKIKYIFKLVTEQAEENNNYELLSLYTEIGVRPRKELEEKGNKASTTDFYWVVKRGDIIVNKLLAWMGAIGMSNYDGVTSPAYDVLRKTYNVNVVYFDYLFRSGILLTDFRRRSKGIMDMRLRLYFDELGQIKVPCPPLTEQTAIANYLDAKSEQINRFIEKKQKLIALLKEQKQAVINELLEDKEGKWERRKLKYVSNVNSKALGDKTNPDYEFTYLDISSVDEGGNQSDTIQKIKFKDAPSRARRVVKKGDVIISTVRTYLQSITFFESEVEDIIVSTGYAVLTPKLRTILPEFLNYVVRKKDVLDEIMANSTGITYPAITSIKLSNFKISVPSIDEQLEIISQINTESSRINSLIGRVEKEIEKVKELKQSLIAEVVTGRIKVA